MNTTYFLVAVVFLLFCIYMLRQALINHRNGRVSNDWPSVSGVLTELQLWGKRRINGEMVNSENVSVQYQYEVNGKTFAGRRVAFYTLHYPETIDFAKRYPQGSNVPAFYNPQNPAESVIVSGLHPQKPNSEIWLGGIATVVLVAIVMGIFMCELK